MKPISVRTRGAWTVQGGGTALGNLTDASDSTGVLLNPATVGDGFVCRLEPGGYPVAGNITATLRGRRFGDALSVEYGVIEGDPGDGDVFKSLLKSTAVVPAALATATKSWAPTLQHQLRDMDNVWFGLRVVSAGATSQLAIATLELVVTADPVGAWNTDLLAAPVDTLIWLRMGDGRARQGKVVSGEWVDALGAPLEHDRSDLPEDADGEREAARWVNGWGAV